jgi:hypothetical protein
MVSKFLQIGEIIGINLAKGVLRLLLPKFASFVAILRKSVRSKRTVLPVVGRPSEFVDLSLLLERSFPVFANLDIGINH